MILNHLVRVAVAQEPFFPSTNRSQKMSHPAVSALQSDDNLSPRSIKIWKARLHEIY